MDDIAGLIERLREESGRLSYNSLTHGCATCGVATNLADEAATQLAALSARVKELEAERDAYSVEIGLWKVQQLEESEARAAPLSARVKELEAEKDHYLSNWKEARAYWNIETKHAELAEAQAEKAEARAIRAEQERGEAYERAAKVADEADLISHDPSECRAFIVAAIRRLASGPEKEKKE